MLGYTGEKSFDDIVGWILVKNESIPFEYTKDPRKTIWYKNLGDDAAKFAAGNYTFNWHKRGVPPTILKEDQGLRNFWDLTAKASVPNNGPEFVYSVESKKYPIIATMYHPEKPSSLWIDNRNINHSWDSI